MRDAIGKLSKRRRLRLGSGAVVLALAAGAGAVAFADVPHTFTDGETLRAVDLNANFAALEQRIAALEAREPMAGTFPAVLGRGEHPLGPGSAQTWFCGAAPTNLIVSSAPIPLGGSVTFSNAFGTILFTNGGAIALNLDPPNEACLKTTGLKVCGEPVTFFLTSPRAQTIVVNTYLDNAGAIYIEDKMVVANQPAAQTSSMIPVPAGPFALSFMACSTDGETVALVIYDPFLTNPAFGLTIDYDRTFHRNGR